MPDRDQDGAARSRRVRRIELGIVRFALQDVGRAAASGDICDRPGETVTRDRILTRILTEDGSEGVYVGGTGHMLAAARTAADYMIGRDALAREDLYGAMKRKLRKSDRMGVSQVDIALWDLAGKRAGLSVAEMLGGYRRRLPAYASTLFGDETGGLSRPEHYRDFAERCFELGYRAFKMHGWTDGNAAREAETVRLLGAAMGGRMALMLDPSCYLRTFADALTVGRACDEAGFLWLEDPYADGGLAIEGHRRLKGLIRTPLLLGEHLRGLEIMAAYATSGATDFLRADPDFDMGITGAMKIAHLGEALGLDVELHAPGPAQRHCMAAMRNSNFYELSMVGPNGRGFTGPELYACGYSDRLEDVGADGAFPAPEGPGLGVRYDPERLAACTEIVHTLG